MLAVLCVLPLIFAYMDIIKVVTRSKQCFVDITSDVQNAVVKSGVDFGVCIIQSLHTTCGLNVNENADPDVTSDILVSLDSFVKDIGFKHFEGNSSAHVKTSLMGFSHSLVIDGGKVLLGDWQGIYLAEFDGPRTRKICIQINAV